jgi:predicted O-methyltransferase YrrM
MKIIKAFKLGFLILKKLINSPRAIELVLRDESEFEKILNKKYQINQLPVIPLEIFFENNEADISHYTFLDGSSMVTDLALLRSLAKSFMDCEYLEIGTWRGESIMNVAAVSKNCTSINLSPDEIIARGFPEKYARLHAFLIDNQSHIKQIHADSYTFDFSSLDKKFDLIFVDGDHSYQGVLNDTKKVFSLLKDENSVIIWHDYGYNPEKPRHSVLLAILEGIPSQEHQHLYHVSNTMCAIYSKRNLKAENLIFPMKPDKIFDINLKCKPVN